MTRRILLAAALFIPWLPSAHDVQAMQPAATAGLAIQGSPVVQSRHELGAVVDGRQASAEGVPVLAITPGGAADRLGLRPGDRLRMVNGRRLDDTPRPSSALESALQDGNGALQVEVVRDGKRLMLSGRADIARKATNNPREAKPSCGYVSASAGVVPRSENVFRAEITQIDGQSTPLRPEYRHRLPAGKHVLVLRELIDPVRFNSSQLQQIAKMRKFAHVRAYKSIVVDVDAGMSHRVGALLHKDKLDAEGIRNNAYWEPVVWEEVAEACP